MSEKPQAAAKQDVAPEGWPPGAYRVVVVSVPKALVVATLALLAATLLVIATNVTQHWGDAEARAIQHRESLACLTYANARLVSIERALVPAPKEDK